MPPPPPPPLCFENVALEPKILMLIADMKVELKIFKIFTSLLGKSRDFEEN
jgi:hypothetical protein